MTENTTIPKNRIEAFSDGVIAIIITIMVLEMKVPHGDSFISLKPIIPIFFCYVLSFMYLGIYWNNHHHLLHAVKHASAGIMWANLHLLFWLSLIPFVTGWMGENLGTHGPAALYGIVLLMAAIAYFTLQGFIIRSHGKNSALAVKLGKDWKGKLSLVTYICAVFFAIVNPWISYVLYIAVALLWFIPDHRVIN